MTEQEYLLVSTRTKLKLVLTVLHSSGVSNGIEIRSKILEAWSAVEDAIKLLDEKIKIEEAEDV